MKKRILALGLALCLTAGLAACGGGDAGDVQPAPDPSESAVVTPEETAEPSATPIPDGATPTLPDNTDAPGALCPDSDAPTAQPTPTPVAIGDPTAPPVEEPRNAKTAAELREFFMLTSSQSDAPTSGFSNMADYLDSFYNLSADDLADFVFYMPDMSTALQEFFLARAKEGKVETVKAACESRLQGLKEEAEFYPGTADFVDSAKVEAVGDWVVLAVCPEAGRMGKILQDVTQ